MNDKLKYDHFKNTKELLEHIAVWYRDDDVYFSRWFGLNDLNNLRIYINQLQSNWNSLREWLENKIDNFQDDVSEPILHEQMTIRVIYEYMENLDKINELEGNDKE